jgi:hypothetical protein
MKICLTVENKYTKLMLYCIKNVINSLTHGFKFLLFCFLLKPVHCIRDTVEGCCHIIFDIKHCVLLAHGIDTLHC